MVDPEKEFKEEFGEENKRQTLRCPIEKPVRVSIDGKPYTGKTLDISVRGAAVSLDLDLDVEKNPEPGTELIIDIDDVGEVTGTVARTTDAFIGIELHIDSDEEDLIASNLMMVLNS